MKLSIGYFYDIKDQADLAKDALLENNLEMAKDIEMALIEEANNCLKEIVEKEDYDEKG